MELPKELTITVTRPGRAGLIVSGEVDATNAVRLRQAIVGAGVGSQGQVEVDLSAVTFIDSTGLRALEQAATELGPVNLVLIGVPHQVSRMLAIMRSIPSESL